MQAVSKMRMPGAAKNQLLSSLVYRLLKLLRRTMSDLIAWLEKQPLYPKMYWEDGQEALAAAGARQYRERAEGLSARCFGGMAFTDESKGPLWAGFPRRGFFLPERAERAQKALAPLVSQERRVLCREDSPAKGEWERGVLGVLQHIREGSLHKAVLARRTTLTHDSSLNPWDVLRGLRARAPQATLFALQFQPDAAFVGATPETLYRRRGNRLWTEAVAGTQLLGSPFGDKEQREFASVKEFLASLLATLCDEVETGENYRKRAGKVEHLACTFQGVLKPGVSDDALLRALHPTPALGGAPRETALSYLRAWEPFDRGWYGAPLGWASPEEAAFAVGIRSALVRGRALHAFAGAGIVEGSCPAREWEELDHKMAHFL
jgi:menaquinone-specific isochorismate synthase